MLHFSDTPRVWSGSPGSAVLGVTGRGNHYGVFGATGTSWTGLDGRDNGTIFALYPHQWKYSKTQLTHQSDASVRGEMKIGVGSGFETETVIQEALPMFPAEGVKDRERMLGYLQAEVARVDPGWAKKWSPMVMMLIRDIASPDREDEMFPYLPCFDKYAGHSWASGDANFVDSNNQESSSESMSAWYGMMLWGEATGNTMVRDTGGVSL